MTLFREAVRKALVLTMACFALCAGAFATVPEVPWTSADTSSSSASSRQSTLDLRSYWQQTLVLHSDDDPRSSFEPEQVWQWDAARFASKPGPDTPVFLTSNERLVARVKLLSAVEGTDLHLTFAMPRLDAVHVAYRYNNGPWRKAMAGDRIPINLWPFADRHPSFDLPQRAGVLDLVIEVAHRGSVQAPVLLQSDHGFLANRALATSGVGMIAGVSTMLSLVAIAAAWGFRRLGFLSIALMTFLMMSAVVATTGFAGMLFAQDSPRFNDEIKFIALTLWCGAFPIVTATALHQLYRGPKLWATGTVFFILGTVLALGGSPYEYRDFAPKWVPIMAISSCLISGAFVLVAGLRGVAPVSWSIVSAVTLYAGSLIVPLLNYIGWLGNWTAQWLLAFCTFAAGLLLLRVLVLQHRHGRMVLARADQSQSRDVLTGLLNRFGFERKLVYVVNRCETDNTCALYMQFAVGDAQQLRDQYGDEGFEAGMVQIASALSTSLGTVDHLARIGANVFAATVLMPPQAELANRVAQKVLTRITALASHGSSLARTVRIGLAWMPAYGTLLPDLERRAARALRKLEEGKRIAWVGGPEAHEYAAVHGSRMSTSGVPTTSRRTPVKEELPSIPGMIDKLEAEMLEGVDTRTLEAEAARMSRELEDFARREGYELSEQRESEFIKTRQFQRSGS
jgi:diguanylate cyclase (GGDEF)-like protein